MGRKIIGQMIITKQPWHKSYYGAISRCSKKGEYFGRVVFRMTPVDFAYLWERDGGCRLKSPSIDRIDNTKDYTLDNCKFIELSENCAKDRKPHSPSTRKKLGDNIRNFLHSQKGKAYLRSRKRDKSGKFLPIDYLKERGEGK